MASAKSPATSANSPRGAAVDALQDIDFTKPLENFGRKINDPAATQRAPLARALVDLLPELIQIRNTIPKWRTMIEEIPGIERNAAQQMQRLDDLNYAVERRSELLQRHRALLTQSDTAMDVQYGNTVEQSAPTARYPAANVKR